MKVLFVGDRPSSKNTYAHIPFVGTPSHKVLLGWYQPLGVKAPALYNSHTAALLSKVYAMHAIGYKVVALGNNASKRLTKLGVPHFKLPHPSPRNRQLNDPNFIVDKLAECKVYLNK